MFRDAFDSEKNRRRGGVVVVYLEGAKHPSQYAKITGWEKRAG